MSIDQRIREGLLLTNTALPEPDIVRALDTVTTRTRSNTRRRLMISAGAVAAAAAVVAAVVLMPGPSDDRGPSPAPPLPTTSPPPPAPSRPTASSRPTTSIDADAARVIEEGHLVSYAALSANTVLTLWSTCTDEQGRTCALAWRLGADARPQAAELLLEGREGLTPTVYPAGNGFVIQAYNYSDHWFVALDGTITELTQRKCSGTWPDPVGQPGRYVITEDIGWPYLVDTVDGTYCFAPTSPGGIVAAENGLWWGLTADSTVGWYDGVRWRYHDLPDITIDRQELQVAGSQVAVLRVGDDSTVGGFAITTDSGETWTEATGQALPPLRFLDRSTPEWTYMSMAFAGTSLFVGNADGALWLRTDGANFIRVDTPEPVFGIKPAGDAVIAQVNGGSELVTITADGAVRPLVVQ